jgi:hypothetical protein
MKPSAVSVTPSPQRESQPVKWVATHIIQTNAATDASAKESRVKAAIANLQFVSLMFYIHVLFQIYCQGDKASGRMSHVLGTKPTAAELRQKRSLASL